MGTFEDMNAALDHRNFVYGQTNDTQTRNDADANYQRARNRYYADQASQPKQQGQSKPKGLWDSW